MGNLKPWVKIALIVIVVGILGGALSMFTGKSGKSESKSESKGLGNLFSGKILGGSGDVINVGVNTYVGFLQLIWLNGGLKENEDCPLFKEYGLKLNITINDDFAAGRSAFKNGDIDLIYCTTDVLCTEMGSGSDMLDAREFIMLDKSRGADVVVVNKSIQTVADLKGKTVAFAESTVSQSLLLNVLETNGVNAKDIQFIKVGDGIQAAEYFKAGKVDACVTWSPIDGDCLGAIPGSKVLISTKQASELSSDGLIAKSEYLEKNHEKLVKLASAILYANSLMSTDEKALSDAATIFSKCFEGFKPQDCIDGSKNVRYVTLGDEINYFGLSGTFAGVTAEQTYTKMGRVYESIGLVKNPAPWRKVGNTTVIEALMSSPEQVKGNQDAETIKGFTAPTKELETKPEISNKKLAVQFSTGSDILDNDARALIDREFVSIAKQFRDIRIRVEGNTDNVGSAEFNKNLSYKRAQSVVTYLVTEYSLDKNRFIIVGNGSKHAIDAGSVGSDDNYRVTEFQLVSE